MFGTSDFDSSIWDQLVGIAYQYLADIGGSGGLVDYGELCEAMYRRTSIPFEPRESLISNILAAVGLRSFEDTGSVVTAVVVRRGTQTPGSGFFKLCEELQLLDQGQAADPPESFWPEHLEAVHRAFSMENPESDEFQGFEFDLPTPGELRDIRVPIHTFAKSNLTFMASPSAMQPLPPVPCIGKCHCRGRLYLIAQSPTTVGDNSTAVIRLQCGTHPTTHYWDVF